MEEEEEEESLFWLSPTSTVDGSGLNRRHLRENLRAYNCNSPILLDQPTLPLQLSSPSVFSTSSDSQCVVPPSPVQPARVASAHGISDFWPGKVTTGAEGRWQVRVGGQVQLHLARWSVGGLQWQEVAVPGARG